VKDNKHIHTPRLYVGIFCLKQQIESGRKEEPKRERQKKAVAASNILYIGFHKRRTEGGHRLVWSRTLAFHAKCEVSP
jgi:hypothetical protein